jgi:hypothetical protein
MVKHDRDGSGHPGWPDECELIDVTVTRWDVGDEQRKRTDHWLWDALDEIARIVIEKEWRDRFEDRCLEDAYCGAED